MFSKKLFANKYRKFMYVFIFVLLSATSMFIYYQIVKAHEFYLKYKHYANDAIPQACNLAFDYSAYIHICISLIIFFLFISYVITKIIFLPLEKFRQNFEKTILKHKNGLFPSTVAMNDFSDISKVIDDMAQKYSTMLRDKDYFENVLRYMNHPLFVADLAGKIIYLNQKAYKLIGYQEGELLDSNINRVIFEKDSHQVFDEKFLNEPNVNELINNYRFVCKKKNEKTIPVELSLSVIRDNNNGIQSIICLVTDVTLTRKAEDDIRMINQQLEENQQQLSIANEELKLTLKISESLREDLSMSTKKAEELAKVKSEFLANMSHEIRTPMTAIIGFSNLLKRTNMGQVQLGYLNSIISSGNLLIAIINDILDVSKIEAGKITLEQVDFNLQYLLNDVFRMIVTRMEDLQIDTYIDIDEDVPFFLKGDPTRLKQILINLLGNATKFTTEGSIGILVKSSKDENLGGDINLQFIVRDTGIGMTEDEVQTIFEAFRQADSSITREYGGTGLGLTICKSLIEIMGGKIWVNSTKGEGSDFAFLIPFEKAEDESKLKEENELNILKGVKVLIVDDNQVSGRIHEKLCETMEMNVLAVEESSLEALETLHALNARDELPQIILTDLLMEGLDGYAFTREVKMLDYCRDIKIVAITVVPKIKNEQDVGEDFDGYLMKPVTFTDLSTLLIRLVKNLPSEGGEISEEEDLDLVRGTKVLVVDDSTTNQLLIDACLKEFECLGDFAANGKEAVEILKGNLDYDMIFMDLQMPVMDGIEAARIIRKEISDDIPIIALTADIVKVQNGHYKTYQMDDFIVKPFEISRLKEILIKYRRYM